MVNAKLETDVEMLSGGEMIARALEDEGVEFIFGYPGGAVLHIYDALFKAARVPHILVRHEQAATHAADGYARATGKPGVVLVTSGPGATNAITGIATAYMDSIPMVVFSGQVPSHLIGDDAFQETDMIGVSRPIVKHSFQVRHTTQLPEVIKKASRPRRDRYPQRHHPARRALSLRLPAAGQAALLRPRAARPQRPDTQGREAAVGGAAADHLLRRGSHPR